MRTAGVCVNDAGDRVKWRTRDSRKYVARKKICVCAHVYTS